MLQYLEQQKKLTINQWKIFAAATIGDMLDFFDFLLIAFVLAFIVKDWNLTYGESGAILLASGISAPLGSLFYGWLADKIGRRKVMIITILNFSNRNGIDGADPGAWLGVSRDLPRLGRVRRHRPLYGRHCRGAGVRARLEARLDHWRDHHDVAGRVRSGGGARAGRRGLYRLGRPVRDRAAAGGIEPADPRLGSRIAALADARGPSRGGASISRLGVDGRPEGNPAAGGRAAGRKARLARIVQISAERRCRLSRRPERDRHHRVPFVAGHAVRHGPARHAGAGLGSSDLAEPRADRRALLLLVDLGCDGAPGFDRADLHDRRRGNVARWVLAR